MIRALQLAKLLALGSLAFLCLTLGVAVQNANAWLNQLGPDVEGIAGNLAAVTRHADRTLATADALTARATDFTDHQDKALAESSAALSATLNELRSQLQLSGGKAALLLDNANATVAALTPAATELAALLHSGRLTIEDTDRIVKDPAWAQMLAALTASLESLRAAAQNSAQATALIDSILEDLRHPEKPGKFVRAISLALTILRAGGQTAPLFK